MLSSFRLSMTWLHTWFGLVLGFVLMVCFYFGALSVFDREIDRWAVPSTRFAPQPMPSYDNLLAQVYRDMRAHPLDMKATARRVHGDIPHPDTLKLASVYAYTTHRDPVLNVGGEYGIPNKPIDPDDEHVHVHGFMTIDPRTGDALPDSTLKIGTRFFFPMHYSLHLHWRQLGIWIVGMAALVMLAALVSGVVMHRKIFRELFTFRPNKRKQRSVLDLHNLTGVVALPFHFMFALSGLVIFAGIYLPVGEVKRFDAIYEVHEARESAASGLPLEPAGVPAQMASVDAMFAEARRRWIEMGLVAEVGFLEIDHFGDENGWVGIHRSTTDRVDFFGNAVYFKASTGEVIHEQPPQSAVRSIEGFVEGLHFQHFRHWLLRWLYFFGGMCGAVCIATGFIFFVEKRKRQHAARSQQGARIVDALAVTTCTGMVIASLAILVANRLLPDDIADRDFWEQTAFWGAWLLALGHAGWRSAAVLHARLAPSWREQAWVIAVLAVLAVLLNALTTGDHLFKTIISGYWPVAATDLVLLTGAAVAVFSARRLARAECGQIEQAPEIGDKSKIEEDELETARA